MRLFILFVLFTTLFCYSLATETEPGPSVVSGESKVVNGPLHVEGGPRRTSKLPPAESLEVGQIYRVALQDVDHWTPTAEDKKQRVGRMAHPFIATKIHEDGTRVDGVLATHNPTGTHQLKLSKDYHSGFKDKVNKDNVNTPSRLAMEIKTVHVNHLSEPTEDHSTPLTTENLKKLKNDLGYECDGPSGLTKRGTQKSCSRSSIKHMNRKPSTRSTVKTQSKVKNRMKKIKVARKPNPVNTRGAPGKNTHVQKKRKREIEDKGHQL